MNVSIKEVVETWELPERPRDFDFDGNLSGVTAECVRDAVAMPGHKHVIHELAGDMWQVWRLPAESGVMA